MLHTFVALVDDQPGVLDEEYRIPDGNFIQRRAVKSAVIKAREGSTPFFTNFSVEKEDGVYPMIAPGAALHEAVRRPKKDPLRETAEGE